MQHYFENFDEEFTPVKDFKDIPLTKEEYIRLGNGILPYMEGKQAVIGVDSWIYIYYLGGLWLSKIKYEEGKDGLFHITEYYNTKHKGDLLEIMYESGGENPCLRHIAIREFIHAPKIDYNPKQIGDKENRYALIQEGHHRTLFVLGLNPSTADATKGDPTMKKVLGFARHNGFDGFVMLNLYPQRATSPKDLDIECNEDVFKQNIDIIKSILDEKDSVDILLAFGDNILIRPYLMNTLKELLPLIKHKTYNFLKTAWQIGTLTEKGFPRHPLYEKYNAFSHFDIDAFCQIHNIK